MGGARYGVRLLVCLVVLGGAAAACDKDDYTSPGGSAGTGAAGSDGNGAGAGGAEGGAAGTGAGGGGAGGGGSGGGALDGGDGGASACTIPCLADVVAGCVPAGACVWQGTVLTGLDTCYANGVMTTLMFGTEALVLTYRRADGSPCYSIESIADVVTRSATFVYKDATGATIGTGEVDDVSRKFTFRCGGESYDLGTSGCGSLPPTPGAGAGASGDRCSEGVCPM
jgi:hypothetical protein